MFNKGVVVVFLLFNYSLSQAGEEFSLHEQQATLLEAQSFLTHWKQQLISEAREDNRNALADTIAQTTIVISDNISLPAIAYAFYETNREIVIAQDFILAVNEYAPVLEAFYHQQFGDGQHQNEQLSFQQLAILDVLFHELGHHATDALYSSDDSRLRIARAERKAEYWSLSEKSNIGVDQHELGRIIALFSVIAYTSNASDFDSEKAAWERSMMHGNFQTACYMSSSMNAYDMCKALNKQAIDGSTTLSSILTDAN